MSAFRTARSQSEYEKALPDILAKGCPLCAKEPIRMFTLWKIIPNDFPYDQIAKKHHMIVPLRHVQEKDLSTEERAELQEIKGRGFDDEYEYIIEAAQKIKSVPGHFHLHLVVTIA